MFRKFQPFFIIAETPLHPGSGSELGIVEVSIQRERHTNFPKIEGSGLKGCLREAFESLKIIENKKSKLIASPIIDKLKEIFKEIENPWKETDEHGNTIIKKDKDGNELIEFDRALELAFGPEDGELYAGALAFSDAKTLLFPVKSLKGIFAWITCPQVIERFKEDMEIARENLNNFPDNIKEKTVPTSSNITISSKVVLEEFTFEVSEDENTKKLSTWFADKIFPSINSNDHYKYWREKLQKDIVVLSDDDFKDFVTSSTEVIARTAIDNTTGTVKPGALWYEEYLPTDTILYSLAMLTGPRIADENKKGIFKGSSSDDEADKVRQFFTNGIPKILQLGGNQTMGKGIVRLQIKEVEDARNND